MDTYVAQQVQRAVSEAKGNGTLAQKKLRELAERDPKLLQALVAPFLNGIVAHTITRAVSAAATPRKAAPTAGRPLSTSALDSLVTQMGRNIGRTATPPQGMTALVAPEPPAARAGAQHEAAVRQLAAAFAQKRKSV